MSVQTTNANFDYIPVVKDFPDVFRKELPGHLIDRDIEFVFDVVPGTQSISKTPFCMLTIKKKELKVQLQELVDKGFNWLSTSP